MGPSSPINICGISYTPASKELRHVIGFQSGSAYKIVWTDMEMQSSNILKPLKCDMGNIRAFHLVILLFTFSEMSIRNKYTKHPLAWHKTHSKDPPFSYTKFRIIITIGERSSAHLVIKAKNRWDMSKVCNTTTLPRGCCSKIQKGLSFSLGKSGGRINIFKSVIGYIEPIAWTSK